MVNLLRRDVVDGRAGRHRRYVRRRLRGVAPDVGRRRVLDALLALRILGHSRNRPVFLLGFSIDDKSWECVYEESINIRHIDPGVGSGVGGKHTMCLDSRSCKQQPRKKLHLDGSLASIVASGVAMSYWKPDNEVSSSLGHLVSGFALALYQHLNETLCHEDRHIKPAKPPQLIDLI